MKFWSEITEQLYNTPEEVIEVEEKAKADAAAAEQYQIDKVMAEKEINESIEYTKKLIKLYTDKYGSFTYEDNIRLSHSDINGLNYLIDMIFGRI